MAASLKVWRSADEGDEAWFEKESQQPTTSHSAFNAAPQTLSMEDALSPKRQRMPATAIDAAHALCQEFEILELASYNYSHKTFDPMEQEVECVGTAPDQGRIRNQAAQPS